MDDCSSADDQAIPSRSISVFAVDEPSEESGAIEVLSRFWSIDKITFGMTVLDWRRIFDEMLDE